MNRYRLKQNGVVVAFAMGNEAEREIMHYAVVYAQDGPVTVERRAANGRWLRDDTISASIRGRR